MMREEHSKSFVKRYLKYALVIAGMTLAGLLICIIPYIVKYCKEYKWNKYYDKMGDYSSFYNACFRDSIVIEKSDGMTVFLQEDTCYNPESVLRRAYFYEWGLSMLLPEEDEREEYRGLTRQERAARIFAENCSELNVEKWNPEVLKGFSAEEKLDMASVVWCGRPYLEASTLQMEDLTYDQIDYLIRKLDESDFCASEIQNKNSLEFTVSLYRAPIFKRD